MLMTVDEQLGTPRWTIQNNILRLQLLPEVGGKITSFVHLASEHEFIFQPPEPQKGYKVPGYGSQFKDFDNSGFDECFPTVAACTYPGEHGNPVELPDHGELWSVPWRAKAESNQLELECSGKRLSYLFQKRLRLEGSSLLIEYKVKNLSSAPLIYVWSSHPLLRIAPGDRILLPAEVNDVLIDQSHTGRLGGFGDRCAWPKAIEKNGNSDDLSTIHQRSAGTAEKYFTPRLSEGWCTLESPTSGLSLKFRFDPAIIPFVGLWINQGGWPTDESRKDYTVAIEPCSGAPDSLEVAVQQGHAKTLAVNDSHTWTLQIDIEQLGASA